MFLIDSAGAKSAREKALEAPIRNCRYGRDIGIPVLMNFVMVMAYCVVSPLILPFGLLYFVLLWAVWRYQMLYVNKLSKHYFSRQAPD